MDKVELLKRRAEEFEGLLSRYAEHDVDVSLVRQKIGPLLDLIRLGEVVPPYNYEYGRHLFNTEGPLFQYADLCAAEAKFVAALEDWYSQPWFISLQAGRHD